MDACWDITTDICFGILGTVVSLVSYKFQMPLIILLPVLTPVESLTFEVTSKWFVNGEALGLKVNTWPDMDCTCW